MIGRRRLVISAAVGALVAGCASYHSIPLTAARVDEALAVPSASQIQKRIDGLHHPLIHDASINLEAGLTPDQAAVIAVVVNPTLNAVRDGLPLADAQRLQNTLLPNPVLTYSIDLPFGKNSTGTVSGYGLGLDWEVTALISHDAKVKSADAAARESRLNVAWQEWQIAEAARLAAYDVLSLQAEVADAKSLANRLDQIADRMCKAVANHDVTAIDSAAAQAAASDAHVAVTTLSKDLRDAELLFNQAVGFPPETAVNLVAGFTLPSRLDVPSAASLTEHVDSHRLDLVALRAGYESQEQTVRAAVLGQFPKITLGISNTRDYGNFLTLGPTVSIDLPVFDHNQGMIAIETATRKQLYDEYISRNFQTRSDIARATAAIDLLNTLIKTKSDEVQQLKTVLDVEEQALKQGNLDLTTYYAAAVSLAQKQAELGKSRQDLLHARVALELAAGVNLSDSEIEPGEATK